MILQDNIAYLKELEEDLSRRKQFVINTLQLAPACDNIVRYLEYRVDFVRGLIGERTKDEITQP